MLSRYPWLVLMGPPLIAVIAAGLTIQLTPVIRGSSATTQSVAMQSATAQSALGPCKREGGRQAPSAPAAGTWWRATADLDAKGGLIGWNVSFGAPETRDSLLIVSPGSSVSGPRTGTIAIAEDDGATSVIHLVRPVRGCQDRIEVGAQIARHAVFDPTADGLLVHLLERGTRRDLGIWFVPEARGLPSLVVAPVEQAELERAGVGEVWTTNIEASDDGLYLAVQSCDPDGCLTRIQDRRTGVVAALDGSSGAMVGFAGPTLVVMGACSGLPCPVVVWNIAGGPAREIAPSVLGAAVAGNLVIAVVAGEGGVPESIAVDLRSRTRRSIGALDGGLLPLGGSAAFAGIETSPDQIGVARPDGMPAMLDLDDILPLGVAQPTEGQP
ncbi:MAG: hypothetical protein ABI598_02630 [Chloroflexota bacterium]